MTSIGKITKLRKMRESPITIALKSYLETLLKKAQKPTYVAIVMMKIFGNKICDKKLQNQKCQKNLDVNIMNKTENKRKY